MPAEMRSAKGLGRSGASSSSAELLRMHAMMVRIRVTEEVLASLYSLAEFPGSLDLGVGQEAVAVGVCSALEPTDRITSTHRGHGHMIAKGADLGRFLAELQGKRTGYCKGKGGSLHLASAEHVFYAFGIVGGGIPIAAGMALADRQRGRRNVCVCFFGDGGASQGQFHETLNIASLHKLPVIFVCENNGFATATRTETVLASATVAERATAYGMPGERVDGNDVLAIYEATKSAINLARDDGMRGGPTLIEAVTYRVSPQVEGEDQVFATRRPYRDKAEIERWRADDRDPIRRFERLLSDEGYIDASQISEIWASARTEVEAALDFARNSALPDRAEALLDVYENNGVS
jgi:TPP-dependent pyruvate/acetoin dehydrogenase alpha subunit